jgi:predicted RNase H-like nuclease (RuvC/YqgF family)
MRESTTQLPWSGGDSELQTLINEDLARENARLRTEAREMQENVAQLQEATSGYEEQRRRNVELTRESERLQATIRTTQTNFDAQRREVEQLSREVDRLKTQLRRNARAPPPRRDTTDMPPPAYDELGAMA